MFRCLIDWYGVISTEIRLVYGTLPGRFQSRNALVCTCLCFPISPEYYFFFQHALIFSTLQRQHTNSNNILINRLDFSFCNFVLQEVTPAASSCRVLSLSWCKRCVYLLSFGRLSPLCIPFAESLNRR